MINLRRTVIAVPILLVPTFCWCAEARSGSGSEDIETITVVGTKVERSLAEVANTISVIAAERIERELSGDIKELVRYEPGVSVNSDAARFGPSGFNIRGVEGNRVAITVDGVPVLKGFSIGSFANSGRTPVDLALLQRVELLRGPASALYGSDALAGVVAFTTRDPEDLFHVEQTGERRIGWKPGSEQVSCWMTHTTPESERIVRENLHKSAMYSGEISGVGPRYCPSIEDKFVRFADKSRHLLYLEPEGRNTNEYYINGLSTSLPFDVQLDLVHSIPGLEQAALLRPAYAVEYDFAPPTQMFPSLESRKVENLFLAG